MILNSPYISGSLTVTGNIIASGSITISGSIASASFATNATSASFAANATSASYAVNATSASYAVATTSASYAVASTSASYAVNATSASFAIQAQTASFANTFTVNSTLTAQTLVVQTITSSVDFVTGSTRFGSLSSNTHVFTGSMAISGGLVVSSTTPELTVGATGVTLGNVITDAHNITGSLGISGSLSGTSARFTADVELNGGTGTRTLTIQSNTSGDAALQILAAGSNGGSITYKRSTSEIVFNNNAVDALKIGGSGAATFSSSITSTRLFAAGAGLRVNAFGTLSQTISGEMTILGHNVIADQSATNTVTVINGGWYSSMIKLYYDEGITFHTSPTVYSANATYPMGDTERIRINSNGNVGIGTNSPQYTTQITNTSANAVTNVLALHNASNAAGTGTGVRLLFKLANFETSAETRKYASIEGVSVSSYNEDIDLVFKTKSSNADPVERLRITSGGNVTISRPSSGATLLQLQGAAAYGDTSTLGLCDTRSYIRSTVISGTANGDTDITFGTQSGGSTAERVRINTDGQTRFQSSIILTNGQINSLTSVGGGQPMYLNFGGNGAIYAGSSYAVLYAGSDERIKSDIENANPTLNKILSLTPRTFKYKERPEFTNYGFIAQEVEEIMPELVKTAEGITLCDGEEIVNQKSIESYGLAWASILVKAIQELKAQNDDLQQQINELKAQ